MLPEVFRLRIVILHPRGGERLVAVLPTDRVIDVIARALADAGIEPDAYATWELCLGPDPLPADHSIRDLFPLDIQLTSLTLRPGLTTREAPVLRSAPSAPMPAAPPAPAPIAPADRSADQDFEATLDDADEEAERPRAAPPPQSVPGTVGMAAEAMPAPTATPRKRTASSTERRATVRYYSRMNPERVFPLLVMLTREEVEKVVKRHVEQKATGPLKIAKDVPLEIEPVLPGCVCHPPKITTRLDSKDQVFTFHVVPHVLGEVTGARVLIRQDHAPLAEIELDMRVVQRTMVIVSGLSTFALPAASAAMKHFGLDFTPKDGSNPYLAVLNFLFGEVAPLTLTAVLAVVTGVLWWYTRPKGRDVFFDIATKPPVPPASVALQGRRGF